MTGESRPRRWRTFALLGLCLYAPFSWLLALDYPWSEYRWRWIKMWPFLPGIVAAVPLRDELHRYFAMGILTACLWAVLIAIGSKGRWRPAVATAIALATSIASSCWAHRAFLM